MDNEYKFSGAKLIKLRVKEKMSISDLVIKMREINLLRTSRQIIVNWESGTSQPTYQYVTGLCKVFKVQVDYFTDNKKGA